MYFIDLTWQPRSVTKQCYNGTMETLIPAIMVWDAIAINMIKHDY